jgi:TRAP-type transport system periplasmic protein
LAVVVCWSSSSAAPIEIKMAHWAAADGREQEHYQVAKDWLEKRFPGRIKCTLYPAQTLVTATGGYEGTVKGVTDIALIVPQWTPGRFPKSEVLDLPSGIATAADATAAYWDFYKKFLTDEWQQVKVVGFYAQVPQSMHMKSKAIRTPEDMKGQKIRIYGIGKQVSEAFGSVAVGMPMTESYEAIRSGIVNGIMVPFSEMKGYRLADVCKVHTQLTLFSCPFMFIMNKAKWDSLPPDIKKAWEEELIPYWNKKNGEIYDRWEKEGIELVKKLGHEVIVPTPEENKKFMAVAMSVNGKWAAGLEAKGLPGKKLLEEKTKLIQKYIK